MLYFTNNKTDCTACAACVSICPVHCISMQADDEGFMYPIASESCIHCRKCEKVCPIVNKSKQHKENDFRQRAFCCISKNNQIWLRSASGGAFSEICYTWDDGKTMFSGAAWDGLKVHHVCVFDSENIQPLCKSKYVSSDIENTFTKIKKHLDSGKRALFCGTPCQVAGLRKYLGKDYNNLLLIDLICHGVGSQKVFQACIKVLEQQFGQRIISYEFRSKKKNYEIDHIQKIVTGKDKSIRVQNDPYIQLFLSQKCLRPSCGNNCKFRSENRQGDITLADFKGLEKVFPDLIGVKKNYSTIVMNTSKGYSLFQELRRRMEMKECSIDDIKKYNPLFYRHTWRAEDRNQFFRDFSESNEEAIRKWTKNAFVYKRSWKMRLGAILPISIRRFIMKIRGGGASK